jgi:putative nucleotidyltransferase with HDIG domain
MAFGLPGNRAEALIARVGEVMTLPTVVKQVIELTHHPATNSQMLAAAIGNDPVLAAKILRTANSSFFGFSSKTADIGSAVTRLGMKQVSSVALATGVGKMFGGAADKDGYSRPNLWKHSVAVGTMNEVIASICPVPGIRQTAGTALLAGLVHDIGIIVEDQYLPNKWAQVPSTAFMLKESLPPIETQQFGFNHTEVGSGLLHRWKFADEVVAAVVGHHRPKADSSLLCVMTAMSELLVARAAVGYCDCNPARESADTFALLQKRLSMMGTVGVQVHDAFLARISETLEILAL